MHPLDAALFDAWATVKPALLADPIELRARLARRRSIMLNRPPRALCIALRASDRRINPMSAALSPYRAAMPGQEARHEVLLDRRLATTLVGPVRLTQWRGQDLAEFARAVGVRPNSLRYLRKHGQFHVDRIKGLGGKKGWVPLVWADRLLDPCATNGFRPPDPAWGCLWHDLDQCIPEDFEQVVIRQPRYRLHRPLDKPMFCGWHWICPGCRQRVRTIYYPIRPISFTQWLGDEAQMLRAAGAAADTDGIPPAAGTFACHTCHRVRYWSSVDPRCWNNLISYMSGGLLFGREVNRPPELRPQRRRRKDTRRTTYPKNGEVHRLLLTGQRYDQIAATLNITLSTVQGHVRRLYKRLAIHSRHNLPPVLG